MVPFLIMSDDNYTLLKSSIDEILIYLGASNSNPISVSNLCINMGFSLEEKELMQVKFCKLSSDIIESHGELKLRDCRNIVESIHPSELGTPYSDEIITGFTRGYANLIPDLKKLISDWR